MDLNRAKEHASRILKSGKTRIWLDSAQYERIKAAITKDDIRALIKEGIIKKSKDAYEARQKKRRKRQGHGKRSGRRGARYNKKRAWISNIRAQRKKLRELKKLKKMKKDTYRKIYKRIKGGALKGKKQVETLVGSI